jgi:ankyrin repeat protein
MSPLHRAVEANAVQVARFLVEKGANMDLDLGENGTPLCVAANTFLSRECAVLLLENGANLYCCKANGDGYNVLHAATAYPDGALKGDQEFSLARTLFEEASARLLIEARRLMNSTDKFGHTPLHEAVHQCDIRTVELLLEIGETDLSTVGLLGQTPLMAALHRQHFGQEFADGFITWLGIANPPPDLRNQAWMDERFRLIAEMLIEAGSPLPEKDETIGAYKFLIMHAVRTVFKHSSDADLAEKIRSLFAKFNFMEKPSPRTGFAARVWMSTDRRTISIFPHGIYRGAPISSYIRTGSNGHASISSDE